MTRQRRTFSLTRSARTQAPAEEILAKVRRPDTWPGWVPEITAMEPTGEASSGDTLRGRAAMLGFGVDGHGSVIEVSERRFVQEVVVGVKMTAEYEVEETGFGTHVHHRLTVAAPHGPLGTILSVLLRWRLRRMQRGLLRNLIDQVEHTPP